VGGREAGHSRTRGIFLLAALLSLGLFVPDAHAALRRPGKTAPHETGFIIHPPEIQRASTGVRKPFAPEIPAAIAIPFRRPLVDMYPPMESVAVFSPGGGDTLRFPEPKLPGGEETLRKMEAEESSISRLPDNRVSLKEEMVTLEDLDTGKYGGKAVRGGDGGREIRGFLHIPTVWGSQLSIPDDLKRTVIGLAEGMNRYLGIRAGASPHLYLSSDHIFRMPFLYITTGSAFELTPAERDNFARYLRNGGFAFLDNGTPAYDRSPAESSLRQMLRDALGCHARLEPIPPSHPIYHCFFEFPDGPPRGAENEPQIAHISGAAAEPAYATTLLNPVRYLEGVFLDGELVAVYSNKGYSKKLSQRPFYSEYGWVYSLDNTPQLKMGVNLVVYALTREGGMNARNMERYRTESDPRE
jgi:hypothetical protein